MNNILLQVQQYLDSVSKKPVKLDKQLVQEFGEACKNALLKQFEEERKDKFEPRMSNIGRPLCQLQMEAKGIKGEGQPYNVRMRNTFGDLIEALSIFVMKSAGVKLKNEQKKGGNVFYVPEISVNADANLQLSDTDMETLKVFQESIDVENKEVIDLYNTAKSKGANGHDKIDAKIVEELDPEKVLST